MEPVLAVDVRQAARTADEGRRTHLVGRTTGPTGGVDHEVGVQGEPLDPDPVDPPALGDHAVHVPLTDDEARFVADHVPQGALERHPPGAHAGRERLARSLTGHHDRLRTTRQPGVVRLGPLGLQRFHDLGPEGVGVPELHHPAPVPGPVRGRSGIPVHGHHVVAAPGEGDAGEQSGRSGTDDRDPHGRLLHC